MSKADAKMAEPVELCTQTHFRKCHVCNHINETEEDESTRCKKCDKPFAPFFYFEDQSTPVVGDNTLRPQLLKGEFFPIRGLTVYWENLE